MTTRTHATRRRCRRIHLTPSQAELLYGVVEEYLTQMKGYEGPTITAAEKAKALLERTT